MFSYSTFKHEWTKSQYPCVVENSKDYKVYVNGQEIPVYTCRISKYPFNTWWPGHQRPIEQTDLVSYVNLVADEAVKIEVEPLTKSAYKKVMVKPYSKGVEVKKVGGRVAFTLNTNGGYVFELDDYHNLLYIFNNKPVICENPDKVTYYFGKGVHFPGKITLKSNESIYVDKDALVYGCIFAEDAENLHIYGNGIFDDSGEERFSEPCYEPFTNGNIKFYDCKNIKIEGVGFTNSAIWCVNFFHCFDVEMDGINVFGQWRYNTDGVDIVNSQRITMKNSFIHSFDDTITIKGIDRYAFESNADMLFENCVLWCDWGRTCEIGLETNCLEYKNITFRDCDILRGGSAACDIQNGDCAEVHHITFEDIRLELETFYTPPVLQATQTATYQGVSKQDHSAIIAISNPRFRKEYAFSIGDKSSPYALQVGEHFASVHHITAKNLQVICDEEYFEKRAKDKAVYIGVHNNIDTTEYTDIIIENVVLNGKRLSLDEMEIETKGNIKNLIIK